MKIRAAVLVVIISVSGCAHPRTAIAVGTLVAVAGGAVMLTTHVRDCSSPDASELCDLDRGSDALKQLSGGVIMVGGLVLAVAGLIGLSNEHSKTTAPRAPAVPATPPLPDAAPLDATALHVRLGRDALPLRFDHAM
jgi:hypothetical protein